MKQFSSSRLFIYLFSFSVLVLSSCTKSTDSQSSGNNQFPLHVYGLNAMKPSDWSSVPAFSANLLRGSNTIFGLNAPANGLPTNWLLTTPAVRDQGQIGSCTGFCGAETDEMLYYYQANPTTASPAITTATGLTTAIATQFLNTANLFGTTNGTLSPLFLYYVERVVINKQSISTDAGANMVNIGEALQGLTSNGSGGTALTNSGYTFKGICTENLYPYPSVINSSGYNVATSANGLFKTPPYTANASTITNAPNYAVAAQSGSASSTGTATAHGYYVISSTGAQLLTDVKTAIANNKPVMMGFNVYDNSAYQYFEGLSATSYTYNPLTSAGKLVSGVKLLGGHAVPIVGYINDTTQPGGGVFIVENSWGTPWGYHGYFYLPYSVLQSTTIVPTGNLYVAIL